MRTTTRRSSSAGVPSIDLIDFDFPCWHQTCDDLTAVSKASLDKSGEAVLEFLTDAVVESVKVSVFE